MPWVFDRTHSTVAFDNKHLGIAVIKGLFTELEVNVQYDEQDPTRSTLNAVVQSASLDTGIQRRNEALLGEPYLNAAKYPTIEFHSSGIAARGGDHYDLVGDLTLLGVTRPVTFDTSLNGQAVDQRDVTRRGFSAKTTIKRADFGMTSGVIEGIAIVGEDIHLYLESELILKD